MEAPPSEAVNRFQVLCFDQVHRLEEVMERSVPVHGRGNFPTLDVKLRDLVRLVQEKLSNDGLPVTDVRLNGGAASYVLGNEASQIYNDLDLIFRVNLSGEKELQKVKDAVLNSVLAFLPAGVNLDKMNSVNMKEAYVQKMVKVCNKNDRWSLISLSNNRGHNVELKFVDQMRRQFEFSVDSFQIIVDSLLTFHGVSKQPMSEHFYPTVVAESMYGDIDAALYHLNNKLIATKNPEEIRGGGLLKYCNLLVRKYKPAKDSKIKEMEKYMCSRFFIDFSDLSQQRAKLQSYLANHFLPGDEDLKYDYLQILHRVVDKSTICLMGHERRQTLNLIQQEGTRILLQQERRLYLKQKSTMQQHYADNVCTFDNSDLIIDQVFYGPFNNYDVTGAPNGVSGGINGCGLYTYAYMPAGGYSLLACDYCPCCVNNNPVSNQPVQINES